MASARSWLNDTSFADPTTMGEEENGKGAHMGCYRVTAPLLGPGAVASAGHACSQISAAQSVELTVALANGEGIRRYVISKPCISTYVGLHLHSHEFGTEVSRVDVGGLAEAAGLECGMQVLSVSVLDAGSDLIEQVPVGLFLGPYPSPRDPDGSGLIVDERGIVQKILSGGIAARWGEFKLGDQIVSISNGVACGREAHRPWGENSCLADYLEPGKDAYLCMVKREKRTPTRAPLMETLKRISSHAAKPRFNTEREVAEALSKAGTYLSGYHQ